MKKAIFLIGGICGVAAGVVVALVRQPKPVKLLAHQLEEAWADYHTVA
ncbi:hypothetical protein [Granulicella aggregans]|nr:hypothetical protein [Granulicella aggregans]